MSPVWLFSYCNIQKILLRHNNNIMIIIFLSYSVEHQKIHLSVTNMEITQPGKKENTLTSVFTHIHMCLLSVFLDASGVVVGEKNRGTLCEAY